MGHRLPDSLGIPDYLENRPPATPGISKHLEYRLEHLECRQGKLLVLVLELVLYPVVSIFETTGMVRKYARFHSGLRASWCYPFHSRPISVS